MVKKPSSGLIIWSLNLVILDFRLQVASIGFMISAGVMTGNVDLLYPLVVIIAYLFQSGFFEGSGGSFMSIIFLLIVFSLISGAIDVAALVLPIIVAVKNIRHRLPATGILIALATRLLVQVPTYLLTQAGGLENWSIWMGGILSLASQIALMTFLVMLNKRIGQERKAGQAVGSPTNPPVNHLNS